MGKSGFLLDENFELDTNLSVKKMNQSFMRLCIKKKQWPARFANALIFRRNMRWI